MKNTVCKYSGLKFVLVNLVTGLLILGSLPRLGKFALFCARLFNLHILVNEPKENHLNKYIHFTFSYFIGGKFPTEKHFFRKIPCFSCPEK